MASARDVLVVEGDAQNDEAIRTFHTKDGKLLGRAMPDAAGMLGVANGVSGCGSRICVAVTGLLTSHELRVWSRKGAYVGSIDTRELTGAALYPTHVAERNGELWVFGGVRHPSTWLFHVTVARVRGLTK